LEVGEGFTLEAEDAGGLDVEEIAAVFFGKGRDRPLARRRIGSEDGLDVMFRGGD
jgi:hypothetical protein